MNKQPPQLPSAIRHRILTDAVLADCSAVIAQTIFQLGLENADHESVVRAINQNLHRLFVAALPSLQTPAAPTVHRVVTDADLMQVVRKVLANPGTIYHGATLPAAAPQPAAPATARTE